MDKNSLAHTRWECKYHIVFAPKYRRKNIYNQIRFSRREDDFCIENSFDGVTFKQMRICHMFNVKNEIAFGIYACSAENSSFKATFTDMELTECKWLAHDGQQPDEE